MDLTKVPRAELFAEMYRRTVPDGANIPSAGPLLPSDTTFTTAPVAPVLPVFPVYETPASDCTLVRDGSTVPARLCCTKDEAKAIAKELGALHNPPLTLPVYTYLAEEFIVGDSGRAPYCTTLPDGTKDYNLQEFREATMANGIGAPYTVDPSNNNVHFTKFSPVMPWDVDNPNLAPVARL